MSQLNGLVTGPQGKEIRMISTEWLKYSFSEGEKADLAASMAQSVCELQEKEDQKKAVMSDLKGQIDAVQAKINTLASKLNSGFEMRDMKCDAVPDYDKRVWEIFRPDTGELVRVKDMTEKDLQDTFIQEEK